ncbi:MAG: hypothetical protein HXY34_11415 [Candidatus Thorarchaeota archaeon]|nr:hypothetical protein [Candidatus Thorarchaeota archaeon]
MERRLAVSAVTMTVATLLCPLSVIPLYYGGYEMVYYGGYQIVALLWSYVSTSYSEFMLSQGFALNPPYVLFTFLFLFPFNLVFPVSVVRYVGGKTSGHRLGLVAFLSLFFADIFTLMTYLPFFMYYPSPYLALRLPIPMPMQQAMGIFLALHYRMREPTTIWADAPLHMQTHTSVQGWCQIGLRG